MSDADGQRLVVTLEARVNKYERDLAKAQGATNNNFRKMERRTKQSAEQMEKHLGGAADNISDKLQGMFKPFIAGGIVVATLGAFKQISTRIAEVGREADKARVTAKVWQQWNHVAVATGMSIDGMTDALKELNIRGDEFAVTGKGSAQEAFERLGYTAADVAERLKEPSLFIDEIIGKLQTMDRAAQARNMDELFGGTGAEELSKALGLSVDEIKKLRSEAALFTDDQLEAAKKIDAQYETMWRNIRVYAKQAAVESIGYAEKLINTLSWLKGDDVIAAAREKAITGYNSPEAKEKKLNELKQKRLDITEKIAALESKINFDVATDGNEMNRLKADLDALDHSIEQLEPSTKKLNTAVKGTGSIFNNTVSGVANYKNALNELKMLVPELREELELLAADDAISKALDQALKNASSVNEILDADNIATRARTIAKYGEHKSLLDLIAAVESGGDYNATLDNGRWTGGAQNLTKMTLNEVIALQSRMRTPENRALYGDGKGSSALGRYQIVGSTLKQLMKDMGFAGDHLFDEATQDAMATELARRRGNSVSGLRSEWAGLSKIPAEMITAAYSNTPMSAQQIAPSESQQKAIDLAKQQDDARKGLNQSISEGLALAQKEAQISGLSTSQQRIELELFRAQQDLERQGITLSSQELSALRQKITLTEQLKQGQITAAEQAEGLANAQMFFAQTFTSSLSGLLTGTQSLTGALQNMVNALLDATLQAVLLGQGPLGSILGGAGGTGILGAMFGFADGGFTGRGGKYQPAGIVHKGEYVMSAAATRRLGIGNLESLHRSAKRGYAEGGLVGGLAFPNTDKPLTGNQAVTTNVISPNITVNASGGTPDQNTDLAKQISKEVEKSMAGMVAKELSRQQRPGNMIGRRR